VSQKSYQTSKQPEASRGEPGSPPVNNDEPALPSLIHPVIGLTLQFKSIFDKRRMASATDDDERQKLERGQLVIRKYAEAMMTETYDISIPDDYIKVVISIADLWRFVIIYGLSIFVLKEQKGSTGDKKDVNNEITMFFYAIDPERKMAYMSTQSPISKQDVKPPK
jgi:hypothetical protein